MMSSLKYEHIEYFIEVSQSKNITKAASNLFISQQALSRSIKKLEEELGCSLFHRTVQGVQLTAAGMQLYETFYPIFCQYQNAVLQYIKKLSNYTLSFCVTPGVIRNLTPELLMSFCDLYPKLNFEMIEAMDSKIEQYIYEDKRHFGLLACPEWLLIKKHEYSVVASDPLYLVVNKNNPLSGTSCVSIAALRNERVLSLTGGAYFQEALNGAVAQYGFFVTPYFESSDVMNLLGMVDRGIGVMFCRKRLFEEAALHNCVLVALDGEPLDYCTAFIYQDYSALSPLAQEYIQSVIDAVSIGAPKKAVLLRL